MYQSPPSFLARLSLMNWVDRRIEQEAALKTGAQALWDKLAASINDAVQSYNGKYGEDNGRIIPQPDGKRLWLTRRVVRGSSTSVQTSEDVSIGISMDVQSASVSAGGPGYLQAINIGTSERGGGLVLLSSSSQEFSLDEACKILIERFLFDPEFSEKRR